MHGAAFFLLRGGAGQRKKDSGRGGVAVNPGAFSGWGGAGRASLVLLPNFLNKYY